MFSKFTQEASSKWKLQFGHSFPWHNFRAKSFPHMALPADLYQDTAPRGCGQQDSWMVLPLLGRDNSLWHYPGHWGLLLLALLALSEPALTVPGLQACSRRPFVVYFKALRESSGSWNTYQLGTIPILGHLTLVLCRTEHPSLCHKDRPFSNTAAPLSPLPGPR